MTKIRIMTYNLHGCSDSTALCQTVEHIGADLIALQNVTNLPLCHNLADRYGYTLHVNEQTEPSIFLVLLAKHPVKIFNTYDLHHNAYCMYSEHTVKDCRFSLLNVAFKGGFFKRPEQIRALLNLDVFNTTRLQFPSLVVGDFFDSVWISSHLSFQKQFIRLSPTLLRGTYPSFFPIFSRDRVYASEEVKLRGVMIDRSHYARHATLHLPTIIDIEIQDSRNLVTDINGTPSQLNVAPSSFQGCG